MKVIGIIKPEFVNGELVNADYAEGSIVQLSKGEASILAHLQNAIDGNVWDYTRQHVDIVEQNISDTLMAIRDFVIAKYAINHLQDTVDRLNDVVMQVKKD